MHSHNQAKSDLLGESIENMGDNIVVQRSRWLVAIDAPVRVVDTVPIHL